MSTPSFSQLDPEMAYVRCDDCTDYIRRRIDALAPHVAFESLSRDLDPFDLMHRYRQSVHRRHTVEGLPL